MPLQIVRARLQTCPRIRIGANCSFIFAIHSDGTNSVPLLKVACPCNHSDLGTSGGLPLAWLRLHCVLTVFALFAFTRSGRMICLSASCGL
jgi:hypothetical protein